MSSVDWAPLRSMIENHDSFLISSHVRPDADALGSQRGMAAILNQFGKHASIINATAPPNHLGFINEDGAVRKLGTDIARKNLPFFDFCIIVDTSSWQQLGEMADVIRTADCPRAVIDHHVSSDDLGAAEFKDTGAAATGELIWEAAQYLGVEIDAGTASWLYAAIATDTGWFRFPSTTAETMQIAAQLIERGAQPDVLYNFVHEQRSVAKVHLAGRVLSRVQTDCDGRLVWITVSTDDFRETNAVVADTEGLVNQCLTIAGSEAAFIAVQHPTGHIRFSLRCRPPYDVSALAECLGGGGHRLASGATLSGSLTRAVERVVGDFCRMLTQEF